MRRIARHWLGRSLLGVAAAALLAACANEAPVAPNRQSAATALAVAIPTPNQGKAADLGVCSDLQAPAGSTVVDHVYASGVQIYRWSGISWTFIAPSAVLSADAEGKSTVGIHYAGPTWESNSGGKVVGTVLKRCTPAPNAIPWLLLGAVSNDGPGIFHRVTHIQRVNTAGGNAPSAPGSFTGAEARVPYTTEYFFFRAP
jgi:hypothetical protein